MIADRLVIAAILGCSVVCGAVAQESEATEAADPKFLELSALPEGLRVTHAPNPVATQPGGPSGLPYTWLYKTTVESLSGSITIEEFGYFVRWEGQWRFNTITGRPFTPADFAQWYGCPDAVVSPGNPCSDPQNWTGNQRLIPDSEEGLWYYIGRDSSGRRVKGQAIITLLPKLTL